MVNVEQETREEEQEATSEETTGREKQKTTNLRSKRRGRYVELVDKSIVPSMVSNPSSVDTRGVSFETLALVRVFEKRRQKEKHEKVMRRRAINSQRGKAGRR